MNPLSKQAMNAAHKALNAACADAPKLTPPSPRKRVASIEGKIPPGAAVLLTRLGVDEFKVQLVRVDEANRVVPIEVLTCELQETAAKLHLADVKPIAGADFYAVATAESPTEFGVHQNKGFAKRLVGMGRFLRWIWRGGHPKHFPPSPDAVKPAFNCA